MQVNTKVCPKCGLERNTQGFHFHLKACEGTLDIPEPIGKVRYPREKAMMTPERYEKFLSKARGY